MHRDELLNWFVKKAEAHRENDEIVTAEDWENRRSRVGSREKIFRLAAIHALCYQQPELRAPRTH